MRSFSFLLNTPRGAVLMARAGLCSGILLVAFLTLNPAFRGAEEAFGLTDKMAHVIAFYALMVIALMAFPQVRRNDMAVWLFVFAAGIELAQGLVGRSMSLSDLLAGGIGILACVGPAWVERTREHARRTPDATFAQIAAADVRNLARPALAGADPQVSP